MPVGQRVLTESQENKLNGLSTVSYAGYGGADPDSAYLNYVKISAKKVAA